MQSHRRTDDCFGPFLTLLALTALAVVIGFCYGHRLADCPDTCAGCAANAARSLEIEQELSDVYGDLQFCYEELGE